MPTVLRLAGYRFYFYSHEPNEPPHIHVDMGGGTAKFWLTPVSLSRSGGLSAEELNRLHRLVRDRQAHFLEAWHGFFGTHR
ncbi:MAG: DUF4160 domain-containing protein [Bauldia sp.]|nr:DUF4160 domain-containing protein [Bauldia sp.]